MQDPRQIQIQQQMREAKARKAARIAAEALQEAKLKALQDTFGNYGNFKYVDLEDFIDPDNQNWNDYEYRVFSPLVGIKGRVGAASPVGMFISHIRDAKNTDDIKKQLELWNSYKPLDLPHNGESYVNHFIYGLNNAPYGGSRPVFPTTDGSNPVKTTADGTKMLLDLFGEFDGKVKFNPKIETLFNTSPPYTDTVNAAIKWVNS